MSAIWICTLTYIRPTRDLINKLELAKIPKQIVLVGHLYIQLQFIIWWCSPNWWTLLLVKTNIYRQLCLLECGKEYLFVMWNVSDPLAFSGQPISNISWYKSVWFCLYTVPNVCLTTPRGEISTTSIHLPALKAISWTWWPRNKQVIMLWMLNISQILPDFSRWPARSGPTYVSFLYKPRTVGTVHSYWSTVSSCSVFLVFPNCISVFL